MRPPVESPQSLFVDGPLSVYVYPSTMKDILEALERLTPLIKIAALEAQKRHDHGSDAKSN